MSKGLAGVGIASAILTAFVMAVASGLLALLPAMAAIGGSAMLMRRGTILTFVVGIGVMALGALAAVLVFGTVSSDTGTFAGTSAAMAQSLATVAGSLGGVLVFVALWQDFEWAWLPYTGAVLGAVSVAFAFVYSADLGSVTSAATIAAVPAVFLAVANGLAVRDAE